MTDPSCNTPNGVCKFSGGANPGPCSKTSGILDDQEIQDIITKNNLSPVWDHNAGVKYITWDSNQWVSYDDKDTFNQKKVTMQEIFLKCHNKLILAGFCQFQMPWRPHGLGH